LGAEQAQPVDCELAGQTPQRISGRILTAPAINSHNTFDQPHQVKPEVFEGVRADGNSLTFELPARSVLVLEIE
jgi:alpha-N-arabinofuranosidase